MLFNFHKFVGFPVFYYWFITTFSCGWKRYFTWCLSFQRYSYVFYSLKHVLKYSMCIWEICTFVTVWSIQYMSVRSCWFVVLLKYSLSLSFWLFCYWEQGMDVTQILLCNYFSSVLLILFHVLMAIYELHESFNSYKFVMNKTFY